MAVEQTLTLTQTFQNYDANYSDVLIQWNSVQTDASYNNNTRTAYYWISINGGAEERYEVTYTLPKNSTKLILRKYVRVYHKDNGLASITVRTRMATEISAGIVTLTKTLNLEIPRKAILSVSGGTLGVEQTLVVNKKMTDTTHTINYVCGMKTGTVCTNVPDTEIKWMPPLDLATEAPQGTQVSITFITQTLSGSNFQGQHTTEAVYTIPASLNPPLAFAVTDATNYYDTYGAFVQGKSLLNIDITTYGVYGAWIASCKTEVDGKTYTTTNNVQTGVIAGSGQLPMQVTATDSRGFATVAKSTVTVLPYEAPKITAVSVQRCNQDGTLNSGGSYMRVKFSAAVSALNSKNHATYYVGYKKATDADHTAVELSGLKNKFSVTDATYVVPADPNYSHTIIVTVADDFAQARTTTNGMSAKKAWSMLHKNGEVVGVAFGKLAEHENTFDIGWPVKFSGGGDCVVEKGEKDGWTYRKWDSGVAECWKIHTFSTTINTAFGSLYCGNATERINYPFTFATKPLEMVTLQSSSTQAFLYAEASGYGVNGASSTARYNVFRPGAMSSSQTFYLSFHIIGKWK